MKKRIQGSFLFALIFTTAFFSLTPTSVFAAANAVQITPASGSSKIGNTFTVSIDGNVAWTWGGTGSVSGTVTFPKSKLKVNSVDDANATFSSSSTVTPSNSAGTITFSQSSPWWNRANNQSVHLFTVTFETIASGTANVDFSNVQYDSGSASMTGGTYTITKPPAPTPSPTPKPTPKPSTKPTPSPSPITTPSPTITPVPTETPTPSDEEEEKPVEENDGGLRVENVTTTITRQENIISWTVNNPEANTVFLYGLSKDALDNDGVVINDEEGGHRVELTDLKLGTLYYYSIKAATIDNLTGANYSGTFTTRGYPVQLTIQQNGLLIPGAKVSIDGRSFTANSNSLILTELSEGTHTATITPPGSTSTYNTTFAVAKKAIPTSGNPDLQNLMLNIEATGRSSGFSGSVLPIIGGGVLLTLATIGTFAFFIIKKRRELQNAYDNGVDKDFLASNYGDPASWPNHTPEPQIGSTSNATAPAQVTNNQPVGQEVVRPTAQLPEVNSADIWEQQTQLPAPTPTVAQQAELASTNTEGNSVAQQTTETDTEPNPAGEDVHIAPEYAPDLIKVEAMDEPSAIYNAEKGELDIIHRDTKSLPPQQITQTNPETFSETDSNSKYKHSTVGVAR